jgi:hypothetical protein
MKPPRNADQSRQFGMVDIWRDWEGGSGTFGAPAFSSGDVREMCFGRGRAAGGRTDSPSLSAI